MKKNIVVCCENMLRALCERDLSIDPRKEGVFVRPNCDVSERDLLPSWFRNCPYGCGAGLPFPCEDAE